MNNYKLLTPGPLTTSETVKEAMMFDHCTWDNDYKKITQEIRSELLKLANASKEKYTTVLMQGSGTFGVESVISSVVKPEDKLLIIANGAYGYRMEEIAKYHKINYMIYKVPYNEIPSDSKVDEILANNPEVTHVSMVHSETTSGILNDIEAIAKVVKRYNKVFIVDAMSSFGGVAINVEKLKIDFLISSSNKCIQGVPGFSFIIANREELIKSKGNARSLALDLYAQWQVMEVDGKWRFTSPTHTVIAFRQALRELEAEGSIPERAKRYKENNELLISKMKELGIKTYINSKNQGPIITTFYYPDKCDFNFNKMYEFIKERGYAIYPGKVTDADTFRIGNIGEIYKDDITKLCDIFKNFLELETNN